MKTIRSNEFKKYGLVLDIDTKEIVEYLRNKKVNIYSDDKELIDKLTEFAPLLLLILFLFIGVGITISTITKEK